MTNREQMVAERSKLEIQRLDLARELREVRDKRRGLAEMAGKMASSVPEAERGEMNQVYSLQCADLDSKAARLEWHIAHADAELDKLTAAIHD